MSSAAQHFGPITVTTADDVATVLLDRPPVNAVDTDALRSIRDAFRSLDERRDVRAAIFTAAGTRAFMGGADLDGVGGAADDRPPTELTDRGRVAREAMWAITDCAVPVIGAINGPAVGAGLAFAVCCDILVAAERAWFGTLEINVGLLGASAHVSQLVGRHKAREMFFLGDKVTATELHRLGAVNRVVPVADLAATAAELAASLAAKSPLALRLAKEALNETEFLPLKEAYRTEQGYTRRLLQHPDSQEARKAFAEKREPTWTYRPGD
jgi:enoyl-CoA hydratase